MVAVHARTKDGAAGATQRHLVALALMALVAILLVLTVLFLRSYTNAIRWVRHSNDVRVHLSSTLTAMAEAEASQRTFLLAGDERLLEPYRRAAGTIATEIDELLTLTRDNPKQQANAHALERLAVRRLQIMKDTIAVRRREGLAAAQREVQSGKGTSVMDDLRHALAGMELEETHLLEERTANAARHDQLLTGSLVGLIVFASGFMGNVLWSKNREIEERRVAGEERERLIRALERSNRDLDQFAYVASHDLKAPLRGIANLSRWIEEDLGPTASRDLARQLELMRVRVRRMDALIEGILSYSRAGRPTNVETVDVGGLLAEILEMLSPPAGVVEVRGQMPTVTTERAPLEQVFLNLIGNALKHAKGADPRITVSAAARGGFYDFAVADNGPGIGPAYHEKIWGIFQTLESRDHVEGTGIGLAIVKKIVEGRGGRAWVESAEGAGATFRFSWPKREGTVDG